MDPEESAVCLPLQLHEHALTHSSALNRRAAEKYPEQYRAALARYAAGEH